MGTAADKLVSIEAAARHYRVDADWLRPLCIKAGIAVEWGCGTKRRRRKVDLSEVDRLLLGRRTGKAAETERRRQAAPGEKLNPRVRC